MYIHNHARSVAMQADSHSLFFDAAWLPGGWARDVRLTVAQGRITAIETEAALRAGKRGRAGLPGLPNLHSQFQRAMAGLAERRGPVQTVSGPGARRCIALSGR
jgi:cytosine/adenosine deaminase-related metal-dependent hydrolase